MSKGLLNSALLGDVFLKSVLNKARPGDVSLNSKRSLNRACLRSAFLGKCFFLAFFCFLSFPAKAQEHKQEHAFKGLREKAKPIEDLSGFLRLYMGDCPAGAEAAECRQKSAAFRQEANQNSYVFFSFEDAVALEIHALSGGQFRIGWLPFFSAFGYGLSPQPPKQWNKDGQPVYSYVYFPGHLPPDTSFEDIARWHKVGRLAAEIIITPKGNWKAENKGKGKSKVSLEGMKVAWKAIRVFDSRSGQTIGILIN
jgi:hypothetical protein